MRVCFFKKRIRVKGKKSGMGKGRGRKEGKGAVAQQVEHWTHNAVVGSSRLPGASLFCKGKRMSKLIKGRGHTNGSRHSLLFQRGKLLNSSGLVK